MSMLRATKKNRETKLLRIASDQAGYFTAKQALKAGYNYRLQSYHKTQGHWQPVDCGVYRLAAYPNSPHEDLVRWSLWSRNRQDTPQAVVSHETALSIHEISDIMPGKIHLTVPPKFRKQTAPGCVLHRGSLKDDEIQKHQGFSVTTPLKTIIDVAQGNLSLDHLESAIRDAFDKGLVRPIHLQQARMARVEAKKIHIALDNIKKHPF